MKSNCPDTSQDFSAPRIRPQELMRMTHFWLVLGRSSLVGELPNEILGLTVGSLPVGNPDDILDSSEADQGASVVNVHFHLLGDLADCVPFTQFFILDSR